MNHSKKSALQSGLVMLTLIACMVVLALVGQSLLENTRSNNAAKQTNKVNQAQSLEQTRQSLLAFASLQGFNSHTQLGHLPCPAGTPGGAPQTTCLQKHWGYLPVQSISNVNYLNTGLPAVWNGLDNDLDKHWMYAVSKQVIQPNELGWSQWVNFDLPAIHVRVGEQVHTGVAAVVAPHIEPLADTEFAASEPALLIRTEDLKSLVKNAEKEHMLGTLETWGKPPFAHENLTPNGTASNPNRWKAVNSECQCRCTKTRCTCGCAGEGKWASQAPCNTANPSCVNQNTSSNAPWQCTSGVDQPCVFAGPTHLQSEWPIARFEPVASAAKSCRPSARTTCPTSPDSNPCFCFFSWPDPVLTSLGKHSISHKSGAQTNYSIEP